METTIITIHTIMKKYLKYLCVFLMILGTIAPARGATYTRVTSWDQLNNGDVVILVNTGANGTAYAMTSTLSGSKYTTTSVTVSSGQITTTSAWELSIKFNKDK